MWWKLTQAATYTSNPMIPMSEPQPWRCPYCRAKPNEPCWEGRRSRFVESHRARLHPPKTRWRNSTPSPVDERSRRAVDILPANVTTRIEFTDHCWTWRGAANGGGYGSVLHEGRTWSTHKLAYELLVGPVPDGLQIDHLCLNKRCCNPTHLEPVTAKQNMNRRYIAKYGCPSGPNSDDPTYVPVQVA